MNIKLEFHLNLNTLKAVLGHDIEPEEALVFIMKEMDFHRGLGLTLVSPSLDPEPEPDTEAKRDPVAWRQFVNKINE